MQQINLYLPEFQPNREPLRSIHMLWGIGVFILLLALVSFFSAQKNQQRAQEISQQRAQLEQLKAQIVQLEQQRPTSNLAELDGQFFTLTEDLARREKIYEIIVNQDLGNNTGFSSHLQALGRQSLDTISLDAFSLLTGGKYLEFAGKTRSVDQIPLYVQRLRSEPAFAGSAFGVLNAEPPKNDAGIFIFSLARQDKPVQEETKTAVQERMEKNAAVLKSTQSQGQN